MPGQEEVGHGDDETLGVLKKAYKYYWDGPHEFATPCQAMLCYFREHKLKIVPDSP